MDFLLILLAIGGLVVAIVMFVLASRAQRQEAESHARVETLQAIATGSVLFAMPNAAGDANEPATEHERSSGLAPFSPAAEPSFEPGPSPEPVLFSSAPEPARTREEDLDLALYASSNEDELADERDVAFTREAVGTRQIASEAPAATADAEDTRATPPPVYQPSDFVMPAPAFPFVLNVSAAGATRGQVSFQRTRHRSRS